MPVQDIAEFPQRGGANGSVRFYPEITHEANAGIHTYTQQAKDLSQMLQVIYEAAAAALGPAITFWANRRMILLQVSQWLSSC